MAPKTGKQQRRSRAETCASSKGAKWNQKKNKRNGFYCIKFQEAGEEKKSLQLLDKDTLMFILRITTLQIRTHDFLASKWPRDCCCLVEKNTQDRQEVRKRNVHDMVAETNVHYYSAGKVIEYCSYARTCSSPHFGWNKFNKAWRQRQLMWRRWLHRFHHQKEQLHTLQTISNYMSCDMYRI